MLTFLLAFAQSTVVACLNLYALDRQLGNMLLFFVIFAVTNFCVRLFMGKILRVIPERVILLCITAILVLVYLGIFAADQAIWIFLLAIPFGFSMGFYYPLMTTKTIRTISPARQGTSNTLYLAAEDIAFFFRGSILERDFSLSGRLSEYLWLGRLVGRMYAVHRDWLSCCLEKAAGAGGCLGTIIWQPVLRVAIEKEERLMRLTQLQYLLEIKKWGSISKAAQHLFMAQPSMSAAIKELKRNWATS